MTFTEKLVRLTAEQNKSAIAEAAGLPKTAISNYIARKYIPRADTALRIARALKVSVEWLCDDSKDWPPPKELKAENGMVEASDEEILEEAVKRYRRMASAAEKAMKQLGTVDFDSISAKIINTPLTEELPESLAKVHRLIRAVDTFERDASLYENVARLTWHLDTGLGVEEDPLVPDAMRKRLQELQRAESYRDLYRLLGSRFDRFISRESKDRIAAQVSERLNHKTSGRRK